MGDADISGPERREGGAHLQQPPPRTPRPLCALSSPAPAGCGRLPAPAPRSPAVGPVNKRLLPFLFSSPLFLSSSFPPSFHSSLLPVARRVTSVDAMGQGALDKTKAPWSAAHPTETAHLVCRPCEPGPPDPGVGTGPNVKRSGGPCVLLAPLPPEARGAPNTEMPSGAREHRPSGSSCDQQPGNVGHWPRATGDTGGEISPGWRTASPNHSGSGGQGRG